MKTIFIPVISLFIMMSLFTACVELSKSNEAADNILPGIEVLGYGYDVLNGKYASIESRKAQVFQFDGYTQQDVQWDDETKIYDVPDVVEYILIADTASTFFCKNSITDYRKEMAVKAHLEGEYGAFTGSVDASYSMSLQESSNTWFNSMDDLMRKYALRLSNNSDDELKSLRTHEFVSDLKTMDPDQIFAKYGTHVMLNCVVGGRVNYTSTVSSTYISETEKIGAAVKASYSTMGGSISGDTSYNTEEAINNSQYVENRQLYAVGGMSEYAIYLNSGDFTKENYTEWVHSIKYQPVLVDYYGENSLKPIWELCDDDEAGTAKSQELYDLYINYCKEGDSLYKLKINVSVNSIYTQWRDGDFELYWNIGANIYGSLSAETQIAYLSSSYAFKPHTASTLYSPYPVAGNDTMWGTEFVVPKHASQGIAIRVGTWDYDEDSSDDCLACNNILNVLYDSNRGALVCPIFNNGQERTIKSIDPNEIGIPAEWVIPAETGDHDPASCYFFTMRNGEAGVVVEFKIKATILQVIPE
jgi:hypothetical protein